MKPLQYKQALITGGSSGIGLAIARLLVRKGIKVHIIGRNTEKLKTAEKAIQSGSKANLLTTASADVADYNRIKQVVSSWGESLSLPALVINSAGVSRCKHFKDHSPTELDSIIDTNLKGTYNVIHAAVPYLKPGSTIVNVSSIVGFVGVYGYSAYGASKHGVSGITEILRQELKPEGITVQLLCPPDTETPQLNEENKTKPNATKTIAGNAGILSPEQVARVLIKNLNKRYLIIPGLEGKVIFKATTLFPALTRRYMDWTIKRVKMRRRKRS